MRAHATALAMWVAANSARRPRCPPNPDRLHAAVKLAVQQAAWERLLALAGPQVAAPHRALLRHYVAARAGGELPSAWARIKAGAALEMVNPSKTHTLCSACPRKNIQEHWLRAADGAHLRSLPATHVSPAR
jgi:hypothetical protein